jgi:hypothetical protein
MRAAILGPSQLCYSVREGTDLTTQLGQGTGSRRAAVGACEGWEGY